MALTSIQSENRRTHLQEGAIYRDRSNNLIRVLSIYGDYCVYVYVSLPNMRCSVHGSVTGLTRKDAFDATFVFVAGSGKDWIGNQRRHALTDSSGIVPDPPCDYRSAQLLPSVDFPMICSRQTVTRRATHG